MARTWAVVLLAAVLAWPAPAGAIMSGAESRLAASSDPDYAAGKAAFEREEWRVAIAELTLVLIRRPWHDNAHAMVGYSWRKLGDYDRSLAAYSDALRLNPRNRSALEYLGEAYLDLGRHDEARTMVLRLSDACNHVVMAFDNRGWKSGCEELDELILAFHRANVPLPGTF